MSVPVAVPTMPSAQRPTPLVASAAAASMAGFMRRGISLLLRSDPLLSMNHRSDSVQFTPPPRWRQLLSAASGSTPAVSPMFAHLDCHDGSPTFDATSNKPEEKS